MFQLSGIYRMLRSSPTARASDQHVIKGLQDTCLGAGLGFSWLPKIISSNQTSLHAENDIGFHNYYYSSNASNHSHISRFLPCCLTKGARNI